MLSVQGTVVSSEVDFLTLTETKDPKSESGLVNQFNAAAKSGQAEKCGWAGYQGLKYGALKVGFRSRENVNDYMFVASGPAAGDFIDTREPGELAEFRCTRIDLQVTVQLDSPDEDLAKKYFELMKADPGYKNAMVGRRSITLYDGIEGQTLYIGRRVSKRFMVRVYDKSLEYGKPLGYVWRFEIEIKRELATSVLGAVDVKDRQGQCREYVAMYLASYCGILLPGEGAGIEGLPITEPERNTLVWLEKCVRPVVVRQINMGHLDPVLTALALDWLVEPDQVMSREIRRKTQALTGVISGTM